MSLRCAKHGGGPCGTIRDSSYRRPFQGDLFVAQKLSRAPLALAISILVSQSVLANSLEPVDRSLFDITVKRGVNHEETRRLDLPMRALPSAFDAKSLSPEAAARAHLGQFVALHKAGRSGSEGFDLHSVSPLGNGANIVKFMRRVNGIEVFREDVGMLLDAESPPGGVSRAAGLDGIVSEGTAGIQSGFA
jgi:hypothetical protein